jgi:amidase
MTQKFFVSVAIVEDLAFAGVVHQRAMLADGSLRARDLVSLYLDRIERLNPVLNAFVSVRADAALGEADQAQQLLDAGDTRPLLGIPFGVKDEHDLTGEVTSLGTGATTRVAPHDSEVVRIVRAAGAIAVGKTTLPELGMHPFTESITWGVTRNPWDLARTPGGSSGGSAAAVAAGLVSFATAGDGGGSIRVPASCCNLFGLKVQRGRVSTMPYPESVGGLSVIGVLTRDVEDAALLYDLLADSSTGPRVAPGWEHSLRESILADPGRLRIGVAYRLGVRARVAPEVQNLVARVATVLRELGHSVSDVKVDPGSWLLPFTILGMRILIDEAQQLETPGRLERRTRATLRTGSLAGTRVVGWAIGRQQQVAARTNRVFDDVDLVLTPTLTQPPVGAEKWAGRGTLRTSRGVGRWCPYTSLWNFIGQPAASIPAGFTDSGVPIGAQLLAPANAEPTLIAVASQLQKRLQWTAARPAL